MKKSFGSKVLACFVASLLTIQLMPPVAIAYAAEAADGVSVDNVQMGNPSEDVPAINDAGVGSSSSGAENSEENAMDFSEEGDEVIVEDSSTQGENELSSGSEGEESAAPESQPANDKEEVIEPDDSDEDIDLAQFANSWRFSDGVPANAISAFAKASTVTWSEEDGVYIGSNGMRVEGASAFGIDVSQWNGDIDWSRVKASGVDYAIIRIGYGGDDPSQDDPYFYEYVNGARAAGLDIGVYIYSYGWDAATGRSEAEHVLRLLRSAGLSPSDLAYPVYYDLEQESKSGKGPCGIDDQGNEKLASNSDLLAMTKAFASIIESAGYDVGVYANLNWWNNYLTSSEYNQWDRWVAQYNAQCDYTGEYSMWQCMSNGGVDGISGNIDINFWFGDSLEATGLIQEGSNYKYILDDGSLLINSWKDVEDKRYYFGEDGYAFKWGHQIGGKFYYFNSDCSMFTGLLTWASDGAKSYFGPDGAAVSGWQTVGGSRYYFDPDAWFFRALKWGHDIDGKRYYFDEQSRMVTGWVTWNSDGTRSYFGDDGVALSGWQTVGGKRYYFDPANACHGARWNVQIGGKFYYFNSDCSMFTGLLTWASDGGKSYFGPDGAAVSGWQTVGGSRYYFDPDAWFFRALKWGHDIDGKRYYFDEQSRMVTGWVTWNSDGTRSYFGDDGVALSGWQTVGGKRYYFDPANACHGARWNVQIGGKFYYFNSDCSMFTGLLTWASDGGKSYFGPDGAAVSGWQTVGGSRYYFDPDAWFFRALKWGHDIDGKRYYFDEQSRMVTGWVRWNSDGKWSYFKSDGTMATGRTTINGVQYDFGSDGRITNAAYSADKVLDVPRNTLVDWLEDHEYYGYYLGTKYSSGFSVSTCMYPKGAPRSDGFTGMNCTGFVAHAYRSAGGDLGPIAKNNNHSPWSGGPGGGSYINAWRWYGYAIDSGARIYTFNNVASMLKSGKAKKGDIIFFKTNGFIDCHIGFFWGDTPNQNKMWHQILQGNQISTCFNNANKQEYNQKVVLIKG